MARTTKPIDLKNFDTTIRPQDDFYRYVNGGWFRKNTIPSTENRWGSFECLRFKNQKILRELLSDVRKRKNLKKDSDQQKMADLYASSMNMSKRNREGLRYLQEGFDAIEALDDRKKLISLLGYLHKRGIGAPWALWIDQDDKESRRMVLRIGQGGLGVPDRNYHVKKDPESKRIRDAYEHYIKKTLQCEGYYPKTAITKAVKTILRIETRLARVSMTPVERRDAHALYNKRTLSKLQRAYPSIDWKEYFDLLNVPAKARAHIIVNQPAFLKEADTLLRTISLQDLKIYLRWHFLDGYAGTLGEAFLKTNFDYRGRAIQGLVELPELWKRSVGIVNALMGDALGQIYVKTYFPPHAKRGITKLVANLVKAYRIRLRELEWMSAATKKKALQKLDAITLQLGYPNKWQSYKKLKIDQESFAQNVMEGTIFHFELDMQKLAKPTDPHEWYMSAPTVNAYYSPNLNQITFPAGILQPPFFYSDADDAVNYGAIGAVIGHELTHGFDDEGSHFDKDGNLKNWWTKEDRSRFEKRTKILERQFNHYEVVGGIKVNGKLTLGENIADLGGLIIAYEAFMMSKKNKSTKKIDGFTPEQRFFISHAISEQCLYRDEFLKLITLNDPHSPSEFRSNGPVSNFDEFYRAFDVSKGDTLYRDPKQRAHVW